MNIKDVVLTIILFYYFIYTIEHYLIVTTWTAVAKNLNQLRVQSHVAVVNVKKTWKNINVHFANTRVVNVVVYLIVNGTNIMISNVTVRHAMFV